MYGACGLEDTDRIKDNQAFARFLREHGADVTESWEHGKHEWSFWDMEIEKVLEWF